MQMFAESELLLACRVIFGTQPLPCRDFLRSLSLARLKSAYRRRALQVHPDLQAHNQPQLQRHYGRLFQELAGSYRLLCRFLNQQSRPKAVGLAGAGPPFGAGPRPEASRNRRQPPSESTAAGLSGPLAGGAQPSRKVPPWRMRLGEFLYYSGQISWKALIDALVLQRKERPRLGDIAKRWGWLTEDRIVALLDQRRPGQRIGDLFVGRRLMTEFRLEMLLCHQRRNSKPIGDYFVEAGLLSQAAIQSGLLRQNSHNCRYARSG